MTTVIDHHVALATIQRLERGALTTREDELAIEEPLEIRVDGEPLAVTMRTPGDDAELAVGFLAGEGLIASGEDVAAVGPTADLAANVVEVRTRNGLRRDVSGERRFHISSSCGICGKGGARVRAARGAAALGARPRWRPATRWQLRTRCAASSRASRALAGCMPPLSSSPPARCWPCGRTWAATTPWTRPSARSCSLVVSRFPGLFACVSGRVSFELVQKAALAGLAGIVAVGAPTSLAVDLARERGMLLCGFTRGGSLNVYSGMLME